MGLIRDSALLQMPYNNDGLVTASNARTVFGVVEDCLTDATTDLTTLINNIVTGANADGTLYDVQLKGIGNTIVSSPKLKFDLDTSNLNLLNAGANFTLSNDDSNDFKVLISGLGDLLSINGDNTVTVGNLGTNITFRRGSAVLDESVTLSTDSLSIQNSNVTIKSASDITGNALEVKNGNNANLKTYLNNGRTTRQVSIPFQQDTTNVQNVNTENVTIIGTAGGAGTLQVIGTSKTFNIAPLAAVSQYYEGERVTLSSSAAFTPLSPITGNQVVFSGSNITSAIGYRSNGILLTGATQNDNPTVTNGWAYLSSNTKIGIEANSYPQLGGISELLRLHRYYQTGTVPAGFAMAVGEGSQITFKGYFALTASGISNRIYSDSIQHRIAILADSDSPLTTEYAFRTTAADVNVEPLKITGRNITIGILNSIIKLVGLPVYADNASATGGGLTVDTVYKTATGELRIVV